MAGQASPAEMRAYIVERLTGDTGEPDKVVDTARALAERALPAIRERLAELLSAPLAMEVKSVQVVRFAEARPQAAEVHAMSIAASPSSPDALLLVIDPQALACVVATMFGGDPEQAVAPIARPLSPTEIEVATHVFEEIAKAVNGSGERAFEFGLPLPGAISGQELAKAVLRDGPAVRADYAIGPPDSAGVVSLVMPQRVLLKHRSDGAKFAGAAETEWRERFNEEVMRSAVRLEATMPLTRMTLGELSRIQPGQVIEFQEHAQSEAKLSARNKTLFVCELGKLGQNYTVRIRHPFDAGRDLMDGILPG